jgi:hypothetical protein
MPTYKFTTDWFSGMIENFHSILSDYKGKEGLRFLEIGSYEGRSASWILENILTGENCKLYCIEINVRLELIQNLKHFGDKVEIFEGGIFDYFKQNTEEFDFVYIDGGHLGCYVITDAILTFEMLKTGGVILFDDYQLDILPETIQRYLSYQNLDNPILYPKLAIDNFINLFSEQCIELDIPNDYQKAIGKTSYTFFNNPSILLDTSATRADR